MKLAILCTSLQRDWRPKIAKNRTLTWWKKKCWKLFSEYIRLRDSIENGTPGEYAKCCSCGKVYPSFGKGCLQAGHYVAGRSHKLLFNKFGVHSQCYNCNINLKGNTIPYRKFMIERYGIEVTEQIENDHYDHTFKYTSSELEEMCAEFKAEINELKAK